MADVSFVFTNPRHHVEMMAPVARELTRRGVACQFVSLAELRGMDSPENLEAPLRRAIPYNVRRRPTVGASIGHPSGNHFWIRRLAQRAVSLALLPRVRGLIGSSRVIVVPNDAAFPYRELIKSLDGRVPVVLLQEGIRFDFPGGDAYGTCGVSVICAWGEASAELFVQRSIAPELIKVTGTPRLDDLTPDNWAAGGRRVREQLRLRNPPIAFLPNPIEIQGFGTTADKLKIFERFLDEAVPVLRQRELAIIVKNHRNEDPETYKAVAARSAAANRVHVLPDVNLFDVLAASAAAVLLTSTVGIDALLFGLPLGVLEVPGHGFGFEYVSRGAAVGLSAGSIAAGLSELLGDANARADARRAFLERHVHARGRATLKVADVIGHFARASAA